MNSLLLLSALSLSFSGWIQPWTKEDPGLLTRPLAEVRDAITPPEIARAYDVHRSGCPVCGVAIDKHGRYSWILSEAKPFKVQCPECKNIFPDNDFEAYWKSGFKDQSLLQGKYVDSGRGWQKEGVHGKYWFVAYYNHWELGRRIQRNLPYLAAAYVKDGSPAAARRALVTLDRLADFYPGYNYNKQSRYAEEIMPNYDGRIHNMIWETDLTLVMADAYGKVKPFLAQPDAELADASGKDNQQMRANIENNLLRVAANDIMTENAKNRGNFGMHQAALLKIAEALNDPAMARWVTDFRPSKNTFSVPLDYAVYSNVFGDGTPMECPGYNSFWLDKIAEIAAALEKNDIDCYLKYPTLRRIFASPGKMVVAGRFLPASGDTARVTGRQLVVGLPPTVSQVFRKAPDPASAGVLLLRLAAHPTRYFSAAELAAAKKIADPLFGFRSNLLSSYGVATLQNENPQSPAALWFSFGAYPGHKHLDALHFELFAHDTPLMPDFGYPDSASNDDPERYAFYLNALTHNTVVVDERMPLPKAGRLLAYAPENKVRYLAAEAPVVFPGLQTYRRSLHFYDVAPGRTVTLDVFRVAGGKQHDYFMHGPGTTVKSALSFTPQPTGTLAGPEVPYGVFYDNAQFRDAKTRIKYFNNYRGSGYQYLTDVAKVKLTSGGGSVELPSCPELQATPAAKGSFLKVHFATPGELIQSVGKVPQSQREAPRKLAFFTLRRQSEKAGLASNFITVFETGLEGQAGPAITGVEPLLDTPERTVVKLRFDNGETHYLFDFTSEVPASAPVEFANFAVSGSSGAIRLDAQGAIRYACVRRDGAITHRGKTVVETEPSFRTKVAAVDLIAETLTLEKELPAGLAKKGGAFSAGSIFYRIDTVDGKTVHLLDQSPVRGRFRFINFDPAKRTGEVQPFPPLAEKGMMLYRADGKTPVGRIQPDRGRIAVSGNAEIAVGQDYWISEVAPGDEALFHASAEVIK